MSLTPEELDKKRDSAHSLITSLADDIRNKHWGRILTLVTVVSFILAGITSRPYQYILVTIGLTSFVGALLIAFRTKKTALSPPR